MGSNIHEGHRGRLKEQFCNAKGSLNDHQLLELLLFYAIPQKDTNPLAHTLINTFGSLERVFNAHFDDLKRIKGMGYSSALLISLVSELSRRMFFQNDKRVELTNAENAIRYCIPLLCNEKHEVAYAIALNSNLSAIHAEKISEGTITATPLSARSVMDVAVRHNATKVILCHNHPSGSLLPSPEDERVTEYIENALSMFDVHICDHIIIAGLRGYSMFQRVEVHATTNEEANNLKARTFWGEGNASSACAADYRLGTRRFKGVLDSDNRDWNYMENIPPQEPRIQYDQAPMRDHNDFTRRNDSDYYDPYYDTDGFEMFE